MPCSGSLVYPTGQPIMNRYSVGSSLGSPEAKEGTHLDQIGVEKAANNCPTPIPKKERPACS